METVRDLLKDVLAQLKDYKLQTLYHYGAEFDRRGPDKVYTQLLGVIARIEDLLK